ncbi:MAG TPA: TetR family transcriptional regulator [Pseudonocardiaceae bacterium]|jgi:AcrR family transcriptional regulator|nr:TetR family transcriptional regulator [Pseudonocardiaceae bacterium]
MQDSSPRATQQTAQRDTRAEILTVARELFSRHGYQRTALREIAVRLGLTKAAVLYHFPTKAEILAALAEPLLRDLDAALNRAALVDADPVEVRWAVIEGLLDVLLTHRNSLRMSVHDLALLSQETVFPRFSASIERANILVAGPEPDIAAKVRAAQAIAVLSDPVMILADLPTETLREEVLRGARRLFSEPDRPDVPIRSSNSSRPNGRPSGRPSRLSAEALDTARRMYEQGQHTGEEIAAAIGVSRATLYRHLSH